MNVALVQDAAFVFEANAAVMTGTVVGGTISTPRTTQHLPARRVKVPTYTSRKVQPYVTTHKLAPRRGAASVPAQRRAHGREPTLSERAKSHCQGRRQGQQDRRERPGQAARGRSEKRRRRPRQAQASATRRGKSSSTSTHPRHHIRSRARGRRRGARRAGTAGRISSAPTREQGGPARAGPLPSRGRSTASIDNHLSRRPHAPRRRPHSLTRAGPAVRAASLPSNLNQFRTHPFRVRNSPCCEPARAIWKSPARYAAPSTVHSPATTNDSSPPGCSWRG